MNLLYSSSVMCWSKPEKDDNPTRCKLVDFVWWNWINSMVILFVLLFTQQITFVFLIFVCVCVDFMLFFWKFLRHMNFVFVFRVLFPIGFYRFYSKCVEKGNAAQNSSTSRSKVVPYVVVVVVFTLLLICERENFWVQIRF